MSPHAQPFRSPAPFRPTDLPDLQRFADFDSAGRAALEFLQDRLGFGLWMLTRVEGDDWIVLQARDQRYGVEPGTVLRWTDSFCSRMVRGEGPQIAPCSSLVPAYLDAPVAQQMPIGAYVGLPLAGRDGALFGTLCAVDPEPQPASLMDEQPLLDLLAGLLGMVLQQELAALDHQRRIEQLELDALTDCVTRLFNRRGWDRLVAAEDGRCRRYGHAGSIVVVDLDRLKETNDREGHHAGDALIVRTARALRESARANDVVARLGGDEFGILAVECTSAGAEALRRRVEAAFADAGIDASIGVATRTGSMTLEAAWQLADSRMYASKRSR